MLGWLSGVNEIATRSDCTTAVLSGRPIMAAIFSAAVPKVEATTAPREERVSEAPTDPNDGYRGTEARKPKVQILMLRLLSAPTHNARPDYLRHCPSILYPPSHRGANQYRDRQRLPHSQSPDRLVRTVVTGRFCQAAVQSASEQEPAIWHGRRSSPGHPVARVVDPPSPPLSHLCFDILGARAPLSF